MMRSIVFDEKAYNLMLCNLTAISLMANGTKIYVKDGNLAFDNRYLGVYNRFVENQFAQTYSLIQTTWNQLFTTFNINVNNRSVVQLAYKGMLVFEKKYGQKHLEISDKMAEIESQLLKVDGLEIDFVKTLMDNKKKRESQKIIEWKEEEFSSYMSVEEPTPRQQFEDQDHS